MRQNKLREIVEFCEEEKFVPNFLPLFEVSMGS